MFDALQSQTLFDDGTVRLLDVSRAPAEMDRLAPFDFTIVDVKDGAAARMMAASLTKEDAVKFHANLGALL